MATLYPSLEDGREDQVLKAQANVSPWGAVSAPVVAPVFASAPPPYPYPAPPVAYTSVPAPKADDPPVLYHNLPKPHKYMGLDLSSKKVQKKLALVLTGNNAVAPAVPVHGGMAVPMTGSNLGMHPAEIKPRLREIHLWKDERGKTGLKLKSIEKGVFVLLVKPNSPAALVGLRIGEQILQIDGKDCAKWSAYKAKKALKKAPSDKIVIVARERPFQRTVTLHKDSTGHLGFVVKKGKVHSIVEGSPAAWNGLLTGHYICEVNGQDVVGLKDKKIINILTDAVDAVTLTIIPVVIYEHMVRKLRDDSSDQSMMSSTYGSSPFMDSSSPAGFDSHCVHSGGFSGCSHDF